VAHVHVTSSNVDLETNDGETVYGAAIRSGYFWPTSCNGVGTCLICWTLIEDGAENLAPAGEWEQQQIDHLMTFVKSEGKPVRLACRVRPSADVVVKKSGVRKMSEMFRRVPRVTG
jgi:2Fe-2S ferredoxin